MTNRVQSIDDPLIVARIDDYQKLSQAERPAAKQQLLDEFSHLTDDINACLNGLELMEGIVPKPVHNTDRHHESMVLNNEELGDFLIIREIGRGGMGVVYEAEQRSLGRRVALKILPFAAFLDPGRLQRFKQEAQAAAILRHPNIVHVHCVGVERGVHYYAMDLIDGRSLASVVSEIDQLGNQIDATKETAPIAALTTEYTRDRRSYYSRVASFGIEIATALNYAHDRGVVHRDIKPSNLMIDAHGKPMITDFGLAQVEGSQELTMTGETVGTLRYMSPEQASGRQARVDERSDIYSLGATLYELLALRPAFSSTDRGSLLAEIEDKQPIPLRKLDPNIPKDLETVINKAIEKEPNRRYETANELAEDLSRFVEHRPVKARQASQFYLLRRWAKRNRMLAVAIATSLALLLGFAIAGPIVARQQTKVAQELSDLLYVQDINVIASALEVGDIDRATSLLNKYRDTAFGESFEWRYLEKCCERNRPSIVVPPLLPSWKDGGLVRSIEFSPNDTKLAIGYWGHSVRIVDPATGDELQRIKTDGSVRSVTFTPDGRFVVIGTETAEVRLWNVATGWQAPIDNIEGDILSVSISANGKFLAAASTANVLAAEENVVYLWPLSVDGEKLLAGNATKIPQSDIVYELRFFPKSELFATASRDGLGIWNPRDKSRVRFAETFSECNTLDISLDESSLLSGHADGSFMMWQFNSEGLKSMADIKAHKRGVAAVRFGRQGNPVFSVGYGGRLNVWDAGLLSRSELSNSFELGLTTGWNPSDNDRVASVATQVGVLRAMAVSRNGKSVATGAINGVVNIRNMDDLLQFRPARIEMPAEIPVTNHWNVRYSPNGKQLLSTGEMRPCRIWDIKTGLATSTEAKGIVALDVSLDGQFLATGDGDWPFGYKRARSLGEMDHDHQPGTVYVADTRTGEIVHTLQGHESLVTAVYFRPKTKQELISADFLGVVKLWNLDGPNLVKELPRGNNAVIEADVSPDGRLLALGTETGTIEIWNVNNSRAPRHVRTLRGHLDWVRGVCFSRDGKLLASSSYDGVACIWNVGTGQQLHQLKSGTWFFDVDFSKDGRTLAMGSWDGEVQLWNVETGRQLLSFQGHKSLVYSVEFSPDGDTLATGSQDRSIILWSINSRTLPGAKRLSSPFR